MATSSAFISYSWDDNAHKQWVKALATRLIGDGVNITLDKWDAVPGDQLPAFMSKSIRENEYVLIICTQKYKRKSDDVTGGTGYEGDIINGEIFVTGNHRKFIPILREGEWQMAAPSVFMSKYYIDLRDSDAYDQNYAELLQTLLNKREHAPQHTSINTADKNNEYFYNLPTPLTEFIGRRNEIDKISEQLSKNKKRVIVISGSGGSGKTRLAIEIGWVFKKAFSNGVCFVELASIQEPVLVLPTIAKTLNIKETDDTSVFEILKKALKDKQLLIVLDNFEHVMTVTEDLVDLLEGCPTLKLLITTRITPNFRGASFPYPIPPLGFPPHYPPEPPVRDYTDSRYLTQFDAVNLFNQIAISVDEEFSLARYAAPVAELCYKLSGIALAIELAAARIKRYNPEEMLALPGLRLLVGGAKKEADRHKNMWQTIKWSYLLLKPAERKLFLRLTVFRSGFTEEAVLQVCNLETLNDSVVQDMIFSLYENNLITRTNNNNSKRYVMLDMVREFAEELLDKKEERTLMVRHADYFVAFAEICEAKITSSERSKWIMLLQDDYNNINVVFDRCISKQLPYDRALDLAGSLFWYWNITAYFSKGKSLVTMALKETNAGPPPARAKALYCAGGLTFLQGDMQVAAELLNESIDIYRSVSATRENKRYLAFSLIILSQISVDIKKPEDAEIQVQESITIFNELKDEWGLALALNDLGNVYRGTTQYKNALDEYNRSLELWDRLNDNWGRPLTHSNIGFVLSLMGQYKESMIHLEKAQEIQREMKEKWGLAETLKCLGDVAIHLREFKSARQYYLDSLRLNLTAGRKQMVVACLQGLAIWAVEEKMNEQAIVFFSAAKRAFKDETFKNLTDKKLIDKYDSLENILKERINDDKKFTALMEDAARITMEEVEEKILKKMKAGTA